MHRFHLPNATQLWVMSLVLSLLLPVGQPVAAQANTYTSAEFGFTVTWTDDWQVPSGGEEDYGIALVQGTELTVYIEGFDGSVTPSEIVEPQPDETVILDDHLGTPARGIYEQADGIHVYVESYTIDAGQVTIVISVYAQPDQLADAVERARNDLSLNGNPLITGDPLEDDSEPTGISRTPRSGSGEQETPEPTTPAVSQAMESYTGPVYGYTVSYDPNVWQLGAEIHEGSVDGIRLVRDTSTFTIWAWDSYGNDPVLCLDGEAEYYATQVASITNWEPAMGADGQPLRYESDTLAWGVFNLTYTNDSGETYPLVDYISCEPIPGQDALLIVLLSSETAAYNTELNYALDVLDTLQFMDPPETDGTDGTDLTAGTESGEAAGEEIVTNLDGSDFISPNYGFSAVIPLEWQILEETVEGTDERLVIGNGTSVVTLWATSDYSGDLAGCIDFAANASGLNLMLDTDASGGEFRGVYRNEAFANFVYEADGVQMMYFINCQTIPGTDGFLILIHDVEYDQFTNERRYRSNIENSIVMP